ncbi:Vta1 like-domain-containing protein [Trametes elegans]|nr:Vta1 like-domain-containing protein [Trametes elegans]
MGLSLPPVPPELRAIQPYLQRADELSAKDPVIAYWCAYYAAQQGIALRLRDNASRNFLYELLGLLERMKTDLGGNDAVHDEPASAAYIENFALRVFAGADNEDRKGSATRNTARKFLAAATFLELLHVFESDKAAIDISAVEEKIKYAKWKAADISKALREGRQPTPGPAGSATDSPALPDVNLPDPNVMPPATPPSSSSQLPSASSPPSITRSTPPPPQLTNLGPTEPSNHLSPGPPLPDGLAPSQPPQSPGAWSTIDAATTPPASSAKSVHFTPSVVGGLSTPGEGPGSGWPAAGADPFSVRVVVNSPPASPHTVPPQLSSSASNSPASAPPPLPNQGAGYSAPPARPQAFAPPPPPPTAPHSPPRSQDQSTATVTTSPPELTPQVVSRVQKHCRYAISALDYEDREQAIKELRTALRMLGG